jgi:hypothetical protein
MIRSIPLTLANVDEAQALVLINDERRRMGDVISCQAEKMIDAVALDDRTIWIDEDRQHQTASLAVRLNFFGALADDHEHFGS